MITNLDPGRKIRLHSCFKTNNFATHAKKDHLSYQPYFRNTGKILAEGTGGQQNQRAENPFEVLPTMIDGDYRFPEIEDQG